ncbi:MAG: hypothetical protein ABW321_29150 [Polyangiales bacterium]
MTAIAVAERTVTAPLSVAYAQFVDYSRWDLWMPKNFRPVSGPARALQVGDTFKVAVGPSRFLTIDLEVVRVRTDKEICWRGGRAGFLAAEHSFLFTEASGASGHTQVRSEESLNGLLVSGPLASPVERVFAEGAAGILAGFAEHVVRIKAA